MKLKVLDEISLTAASVQRQQKHWTRTQHRLRDRCSDPDEASEHVRSDSRSFKGAEGSFTRLSGLFLMFEFWGWSEESLRKQLSWSRVKLTTTKSSLKLLQVIFQGKHAEMFLVQLCDLWILFAFVSYMTVSSLSLLSYKLCRTIVTAAYRALGP